MNWQQVADNWPAFVQVISNRWPRTDAVELETLDGDRERFESYLSSAHDLTRAEAREEIETWLVGAVPADVAMSDEQDNANISASGRHIPPGEDVYAEDRDFGDDRVEERPIGRSDPS